MAIKAQLRWRRGALGLCVAILVGCAGEAPMQPPISTPVATPEAPTSQEAVPEPQLPTGPAATTSGKLTEKSLVIPEGWEPIANPGSVEDGYVGNGTWVHEVDPVLRGAGTLAVGCIEEPPDLSEMLPVGALEGTLDRDGAPGITLAFEFADADAAQQFYRTWLTQAEACVGTVADKIDASDTSWAGYRHLDEVWSEASAVDGTVAKFVIVDGKLAEPEVVELVRRLRAS